MLFAVAHDGFSDQVFLDLLRSRDEAALQRLVGAYLPTAEITIVTEDPFPGIPRTRADRPFDVEVTVHGLLSGPGLPEASKKVLFEQYAAHYPQSQTLTRDEALAGNPIRTTYIEQNEMTKYQFPSTSLTGPDLTKVSGEEHFIVHALPDGEIAKALGRLESCLGLWVFGSLGLWVFGYFGLWVLFLT